MARKPRKHQYTTYSNLAKSRGKSRRALKKDLLARQRAEYLATLPKNPIKRFFARLHPKRVFKYWFSRRGLKMFGKIVGLTILLLALAAGALFMYFRKELDSLRPEELAKRVQTTVTKYYDRNGELLWEDTGTGEYRLVVESDQISKHMKDATVAIEDKDFFKHGGVSLSGTIRAVFNNVSGTGGVQGGSTLTQQLIKQVFFADEAGERGIKGIPRKIKEAILSIEAERVYSKDQILTMYLNESPYGGRRNGVESASQTYFGHAAKDLTLAEAALLAAIPQSPTLYNPYNTDGNQALVSRQHTVLDYMAEQGYITKSQAEEAKAVAILDTIKPLDQQLTGAKAPHFIQMVKDDLTDKLGAKVVGQGGLTVKTTLDLRVQTALENQMDTLFNGKYSYLPRNYGFDNASFTMIDNQTGQVLGMMGSRDYNYPDYGAVNSATSFIQPGSSIKPLVYASLINNQNNPNGTFGAGSIIADSPIPQSIYRTADGTSVKNADGKFKGNLAIRQDLAESRNVPAIKAMALNGIENSWDFIRAAGDKSYCTDGADQTAGLASAIGGCGAKQVEHANAFATLARGGVYKSVSDIIEVKNSSQQTLYQWKDDGQQVMDAQTAYIISDILTDDSARQGVFGWRPAGYYISGIKTATKTGTSNIGNYSKDLWMMSYTPKATLSVWAGNHVPKALKGGDGMQLGPIVRDITNAIYNNVFIPDGTYKSNQWFTKPAGVQTLTVNGKTDIFPSWYNKSQKTVQTVKMTFDKSSKKKAGTCTPDNAKEELDVVKNVDPVTKVTTYTPPDGYNAEQEDDFHRCDDVPPFVSVITATPISGDKYMISTLVRSGTHSVSGVTMSVNGNTYNATANSGSWEIVVDGLSGSFEVSATATDAGYYTGTGSQSLVFTNSGGSSP
jgi:penicillin-binding protein 1A